MRLSALCVMFMALGLSAELDAKSPVPANAGQAQAGVAAAGQMTVAPATMGAEPAAPKSSSDEIQAQEKQAPPDLTIKPSSPQEQSVPPIVDAPVATMQTADTAGQSSLSKETLDSKPQPSTPPMAPPKRAKIEPSTGAEKPIAVTPSPKATPGQQPKSESSKGAEKPIAVTPSPETKPQPKPVLSPQTTPTVDRQRSRFDAVQIYREDTLLELIRSNQHLKQILADECQLTQDIEARAKAMKLPAYQFLWGTMLAEGVCVEPHVELGFVFIREAAAQGLPSALDYLGNAYAKGRFVHRNMSRAIPLMMEAASLGLVRAQIRWVEMLIAGHGSPRDYPTAYSLLFNSIVDQIKDHQDGELLLNKLAQKMPPEVVRKIRQAY